jgi:hypothetical protein
MYKVVLVATIVKKKGRMRKVKVARGSVAKLNE